MMNFVWMVERTSDDIEHMRSMAHVGGIDDDDDDSSHNVTQTN